MSVFTTAAPPWCWQRSRPAPRTATTAAHPAGEQRSLRVEPRIASNNQLSIQQMCTSGLGLALQGSIDVADDVASGRLVRLLPG